MNEITNAYNYLKNQIANNGRQGAEYFVTFVKEYSNDEKLQSEAVALKSEFDLYNDEVELQKEIVQDMESLASIILKNGKQDLPAIDLSNIEKFWQEKRTQNNIVFKCNNVDKHYKKTNFLLKNVNLTLTAGEITGLVGENGNGKTTLLKIIAGEIAPDKGKLYYPSIEDDENVEKRWENIKKQIAFVPQELGKLLGNAIQAIQYSAALHGILGDQNKEETEYIITRLGLGSHKNTLWHELSGGFKLRFALAVALVWKPKIIVLDEPLANLDINTQIRVLNDLRDLAKNIKRPISVIISSQNIEEVEAVSDNMIFIKDGQLKYNRNINSILEDRKESQFEFKCDYSIDELKNLFFEIGQFSLYFNGFTYYLTIAKILTALDFLKFCAKKNILLYSFQDISTSVKRFIAQTKPR